VPEVGFEETEPLFGDSLIGMVYVAEAVFVVFEALTEIMIEVSPS